MLRLISLLTGLAVAAPVAAAEADQVFQGSVGATPIVAQLSVGGGDVFGKYFYRTTRMDIELQGKWTGSRLELAAETTGDRLTLAHAGAGLAGTLTTAKGRTLPVRLQPAAAPPRMANLPADLDLYERLQLDGLTLTPGATQAVDGKTIRWVRNDLTGIRLFRVESGYPAPAMARMNAALARQQWKVVSAWLQCPGSDGKPGVDGAEADKPWLGPAYVSYVFHSSWSCAGAAHPDFGTDGHSFDGRTGAELTLDQVLPIKGRPAPKEDSDAWLTYRSEVFAPAVVAMMKRLHPDEMGAPAADDDCDYRDADVWDFPAWALTAKGLWLGPVFARVERACDTPDWPVIPWSALPAR